MIAVNFLCDIMEMHKPKTDAQTSTRNIITKKEITSIIF